MDDYWTYPYSDPDANAPSLQPLLLDQVWGAVADNLRAAQVEDAAQAEAAALAEADRRADEFEQARIWDCVDDGRNVQDVPLPLEAPARPPISY